MVNFVIGIGLGVGVHRILRHFFPMEGPSGD